LNQSIFIYPAIFFNGATGALPIIAMKTKIRPKSFFELSNC